MIKVLFVARYRDETMNRKVELLAANPDITVWQICPRHWRDEFVQTEQAPVESGRLRRVVVPLVGRVGDPHRVLYRTLFFGMNRFRPDIVHAEEEPDSLAALQIALARRLASPRSRLVLYTWQNVDRPKHWYVEWVRRTTMRASDAMLCANREAVELLRQAGYEKHVEIFPAIGVDTRVFSPCPRNGEVRQQFVIGYLGRLSPEKGIDLLIEALSRLIGTAATEQLSRTVELRIAGGGPARQRLEEQARALGLDAAVWFVPALTPAQISGFLCQLDVLVVPSRSTAVWKEQFGRVLVEAMACKVPVIGAASGAIPEVIGDAGLVFPEGDVEGLAVGLHRVCESPALAADMAERGYARVLQMYTQERIAEQTAALYRRLMGWEPR